MINVYPLMDMTIYFQITVYWCICSFSLFPNVSLLISVSSNQTYVKAGDNISLRCLSTFPYSWFYNGEACVRSDGINCVAYDGCHDVALHGCSVSENNFDINVQLLLMDNDVGVWTCYDLFTGDENSTIIIKYGNDYR